MTQDVVVLSAVRSAIGSYSGALSSIEPSELAGTVMQVAVERSGVDPHAINYVTVGNCIPTEARYPYVARVASVYSPNGGDNLLPGQHFSSTNKFCYKLEFLQSLKNHWQQNIKYNQELQILAGDFNVAHTSLDIHNPQTEQLLFSAPEKLALQSLLNLPLLDAYRTLNPNTTEFSWWHYQASAFSKNLGARIDYILVSSFTADFLTASYHHINQTRAVEKPSDHCAVLAEIKI